MSDVPEPNDDTVPTPPDTAGPGALDQVDLDAIERDLTSVEVALARLADGTYWTDEVTGQPLPDAVLENDPTARRA